MRLGNLRQTLTVLSASPIFILTVSSDLSPCKGSSSHDNCNAFADVDANKTATKAKSFTMRSPASESLNPQSMSDTLYEFLTSCRRLKESRKASSISGPGVVCHRVSLIARMCRLSGPPPIKSSKQSSNRRRHTEADIQRHGSPLLLFAASSIPRYDCTVAGHWIASD